MRNGAARPPPQHCRHGATKPSSRVGSRGQRQTADFMGCRTRRPKARRQETQRPSGVAPGSAAEFDPLDQARAPKAGLPLTSPFRSCAEPVGSYVASRER